MSDAVTILGRLNQVCAVLFAVECGMRMSALGFVGHPASFASDPWNMLDLALVLAGIYEVRE